MGDFQVRPMRREELDWAIRLAAEEGWNPGLGDAECFYRTDPEGFLIGTLDGTPVGCISAVRYPEHFGFMGFYIIVPEQRGRGFGMRLWDAAMERMRGYNAGGDGVVAMVPKYLTVGFHYAHRNFRYAGEPPLVERLPSEIETIDGRNGFEAIAAYDRQCFPAPRREFLRCWLSSPHATSVAMRRAGEVQGFGTIRECVEGYKVGPLFADGPEVADALFRGLCHSVKGRGPVFLDTPEPNIAATGLAERYGMRRGFETARIYTGPPPEIDLQRVFGVTSFELG